MTGKRFMDAREFDFQEHEMVRELFRWGSYGKEGDEEMSINLLKNLSTNHIYNIQRTQLLEDYVHDMFILELCYRIEKEEE